jgi:hypothetical protein
MTVSDVNGKQVYRMDTPSQKQAITLSNARPGLYLLKVRFTGSNEELTTRFVVE